MRQSRKNERDIESLHPGERLTTDEKDPQILIEHLHRYLLARRFCEGKTILDIASGEGYGSRILASVAKHVTGVDIDKKVVDHASQKYRRDNLYFKQGSALEIPLPDDSMDVVVSFETLEHLAEHDKMLAELNRVMKPGGVLIISTPDKTYYSDEPGFKNPFHIRELDRAHFKILLERYFSPVQMFAQYAAGMSVIYSLEGNSRGDYWYAEGDLNEQSIRPEIPAKYLVAIAGGEGRSYSGISIFNGKKIEERINGNELDSVLRSKTYLLGKNITAPYRWLKRLFN